MRFLILLLTATVTAWSQPQRGCEVTNVGPFSSRPPEPCIDGQGFFCEGEGCSLGSNIHCCVGDRWVPQGNHGIEKCDSFPGIDASEKINACILEVERNGGGIADATGITGIQTFSSTINLCQQPSGSANLKLLLGRVSLLYTGTGDAFLAETPSDASRLCRFVEVVGAGRYSTTISTALGVTSQSLFHTKYTTHVGIRDLTLYAPGSSENAGTSTYGIWDEQSLDTTITDVLVKSNVTSYVAGQSAIFLDGSGYTHGDRINTIGGEYGWRLESDADAVPGAIGTAMGYAGGVLSDGNSLHSIRLSDIESITAWKAGFFMEASAAGYGINRVSIFGLMSYSNGEAGANTDIESGVYLKGRTGQQVEGVQIFGLWSYGNNMHGVVLDGNVARCEIHGRASENGNGSGTPPTAYQLSLMNGSVSGAPAENKIYMVLNATGTATNQALLAGTNSVGNEVHVDTFTYATTISTLANFITLKTSTGFLVTGNTVSYGATALANLGSPSNGTIMYCSDCTVNSVPCTGSGTGAIAKRLNGAWRCD